MNKAELISAMAERGEITKQDAEKALNSFMSVVKDALKDGEAVQLIGFGTFEVVERKEKKGLNPRTKEEIIIPSCKVPKFKAGKPLKDFVK